MLRQLTQQQLVEHLAATSCGAVFFLAPNYEERSIGSAVALVELSKEIPARRLASMVLKFQSGLKPVILDRIKNDNNQRAIRYLESRGVSIAHEGVTWPFTQEHFQPILRRLLDLCGTTGPESELFLDISALPRSLLLGLLDSLMSMQRKGRIRVGQSSYIVAVHLIYTPAERYPVGHANDLPGAVYGRYHQQRLDEFLARPDAQTDLVLSLAGTAHDAAQVVSSVPAVGSVDLTTVAFHFFSHENAAHSFEKIALNAWTLRQLSAMSADIRYFFGVEHTADSIADLAARAAIKHLESGEPNSSLVLAGFGPKIVGIACYLGKRVYDQIMVEHDGWSKSDVLLAGSDQYTTIYSIGRREPVYFRIDLPKSGP